VLVRLEKRSYVAAHAAAVVHLGFGDVERSLDLLETAVEQRSMWIVWLKMDPLYDALGASPRFAALLAKIGLPA